MNLLKKFNLYACKEKGWLPYTYGTKKYSEMSKKERDIVDSFEGKSSYEDTYSNKNYYLRGIVENSQFIGIGMK